MAATIQIKRGVGVPVVALAAGEPAFDTTNRILYVGDGAVNTAIGIVSSLTVVTVNGISGSFSAGATPALTLTLGAITPTSVNGLTISTTTGTLTVTNAKTVSFANSISFAGTDGTTITMPTATSTVLANSLGISGGTTLIGGTGTTDKVIFQATSGNKTVAETNTYRFLSGNNGAQELLRIGDGPTGNTGELGLHAVGSSSSTNYILRATATVSYFNAASDIRLQVAGSSLLTGSTTLLTLSKNTIMAAATKLTLAAGTTTVQPLLFTSGTNLTTGVAGSMEYNGTNLFFTRTGTTREGVLVGNSGAAAPSTSIGAAIVNYYGSSATNFLGDPVGWFSIVDNGGSTRKIPYY